MNEDIADINKEIGEPICHGQAEINSSTSGGNELDDNEHGNVNDIEKKSDNKDDIDDELGVPTYSLCPTNNYNFFVARNKGYTNHIKTFDISN